MKEEAKVPQSTSPPQSVHTTKGHSSNRKSAAVDQPTRHDEPPAEAWNGPPGFDTDEEEAAFASNWQASDGEEDGLAVGGTPSVVANSTSQEPPQAAVPATPLLAPLTRSRPKVTGRRLPTRTAGVASSSLQAQVGRAARNALLGRLADAEGSGLVATDPAPRGPHSLPRQQPPPPMLRPCLTSRQPGKKARKKCRHGRQREQRARKSRGQNALLAMQTPRVPGSGGLRRMKVHLKASKRRRTWQRQWQRQRIRQRNQRWQMQRRPILTQRVPSDQVTWRMA